jgi:hypothetical protein
MPLRLGSFYKGTWELVETMLRSGKQEVADVVTVFSFGRDQKADSAVVFRPSAVIHPVLHHQSGSRVFSK